VEILKGIETNEEIHRILKSYNSNGLKFGPKYYTTKPLKEDKFSSHAPFAGKYKKIRAAKPCKHCDKKYKYPGWLMKHEVTCKKKNPKRLIRYHSYPENKMSATDESEIHTAAGILMFMLKSSKKGYLN
jgi:hypothetical protein